MLDNRTKAKLEEHIAVRSRNITRGIYIAHRYVNEWALTKWKEDGWIRKDSLITVSEFNNLVPQTGDKIEIKPRGYVGQIKTTSQLLKIDSLNDMIDDEDDYEDEEEE